MLVTRLARPLPRSFCCRYSSFHFPEAALANVLSSKPWPPWLRQEMRSNWAGETGAVAIYRGSQAALGRGLQSTPERTALADFVAEHMAHEEAHLDAMAIVVNMPRERSWLPAAPFGWLLGYASTAVRGPRGMYVTTHAVESFVEEHYGEQIERLSRELDAGELAPADAYAELLSLLRAACADEVHHKTEAAERAAADKSAGSAAMLADKVQFQIVYWGSRVGAAIAKRL